MFRMSFLVVFFAIAVSGCSSSRTNDLWMAGIEASKPLFVKADECNVRISSKHSVYMSNYPRRDDPQTSQKLSNPTPISPSFIDMASALNSDFAECDALRYQAASTQHFLYGRVVRQHMERKTHVLNDLSKGKFKTVGEYVKRRMELIPLRSQEWNSVSETLKLQVDQERNQSRESFAEGMKSLGNALEAYDKQQKEMMRSQNPTLICRKAGGYAPGTMVCQ
jgi:hypothetical protein